jgi:hypothetical protein
MHGKYFIRIYKTNERCRISRNLLVSLVRAWSTAVQCLKTPQIFPVTIRVGTNTGACIITISFIIYSTSVIPPESSIELESLPSSENQFPSLLPVLQIGVLFHAVSSSRRTTT